MTLRQPDDFHVHLRQDPQHRRYALDALQAGFRRVLVMPNTLPPLTEAAQIQAYAQDLSRSAPGLEILTTFKVQKTMTPEHLKTLKEAGVLAGKLYPAGVTTNSADGIAHLEEALPVFQAMEDLGLVLCLHGEDPQAFTLDREQVFLDFLGKIVQKFPKLKIVLEHVSTADGVQAVKLLGPQVAATVTVHHLLYVFDDLMGGSFNPHLFCKPLLKRAEDREALQAVVLESHPRFFYGSDSAPHLRSAKESAVCAPGIYSMPVGLPLLAQFFEDHKALHRLENFTSRFGAEFYGLGLNNSQIELEKTPWTVPAELHGVVPLAAGQTLNWKVK